MNDVPSRSRRNFLLDSKAIAVARTALEDFGEGEIGEHLRAISSGKHLVTHHFATKMQGYRGWEWQVVLACAPGTRRITVNELALLPGEGALRAPEWVPYIDRVQPGDLGPNDDLPPRSNDPRLADIEGPHTVKVPGSCSAKQLTRQGLDDARSRWQQGKFGPSSEFATRSKLQCADCAFYLPVGEPVGPRFGVCVNEYSADGRIVHSGYGCGAHTDTPPADILGQPIAIAFDDEKTIEV
ncbi:DUF3027 domain-containing protein [Corynebacterium freiburgense]|uniref:DUF3027 domain-containing protein n=1 Tax=Corynebacterium freiburgense TaxID=556548 RepID=UPI0003FDA513|nr:DUF3027 domain-containing protein [Corynebacterium freiburgense]WJZ02012.1 hypothetical protein CFREI_03560 [Corynebacterium freiburgense]